MTLPPQIQRRADRALEQLDTDLQDGRDPAELAKLYIKRIEAVARRAEDRTWLSSRAIAHLYRRLEEERAAQNWLVMPKVIAVIEALGEAREPMNNVRAGGKREGDPPE